MNESQQSDELSNDFNISRQKETEHPRQSLKTGLSIASRWGGWGDVQAGLKVAEVLQGSRDIELAIFVPSFATAVKERISDNLSVIDYKRRPKPYGEFHFLNDKVIPEDIMISVCGSPVPDQGMLPGKRISIEEFGVPPTKSNLVGSDFHISTGFKFDPEKKGTIQSGIFLSREYENLLDRSTKERDQLTSTLGERISKATGEQISLEGQRLGLYYISSLEAKHIYFDALEAALPHIDQPITIIAPMSPEKPELEETFKQDMIRRGFNYIANGASHTSESSVTIVNPSGLDFETFAIAQALTNIPHVATGDQSLSEAIQKSLHIGSEAPFFYYCTFVNKEEDFVDFISSIDPNIANILASYYLQSLPENMRSKGESIKKLYPNLLSPEELGKLFYDYELIEAFNATVRQIPNQLIEDRKGYVDRPEDIIEAGTAIKTLLEAIRDDDQDRIRGLLVK